MAIDDLATHRRRLLLVTFHFPPAYGSGVQRMVAFARDLAALGWGVDVLTICTSALPDTAPERLVDIAPGTRVIRAFGLDNARQLSFHGKYSRLLSLPDRWISWRLGGVLSGLRYIRAQRPDAVMSSFPIATTHLIAGDLACLTGVPWLADFRDPMAQDEYPKNAAEWRSYRRVEERVVRRASALTFTTRGALDYYRMRYGARLDGRCHIVSNGFDERIFAEIEQRPPARRVAGSPLTLLHSGLLYPWERNPLPFFGALKHLLNEGFWSRYPARFVFRASAYDAHFAAIIAELGLQSMVEFLPRIDYREALREIVAADALILFQAKNSNFQIPAKAYEYLRAMRPVLAVVDPQGDTAELMRECNNPYVADIESEQGIVAALERLLPALRAGTVAVPGRESVQSYSRQVAARALAGVLDGMLEDGGRH